MLYVSRSVGKPQWIEWNQLSGHGTATGVGCRPMSAEFAVSEVFPAQLSTPAAARQFVVRSLRNAGVPVDDAVPVVVSELVTNSVLHAASTARIDVVVGDGVLRVEVHDADPTLPVLRHPTPETVTGRGLMLVDALTDRWGAEATDGGKVVWFELDR